ncbi:hypothetical protein AB0L82_36465 [Nocardia sp. NPDC052001]|uniref:hypothetical protein n=1 Tax=Nocardia sp. NPDC052001 TaxID=3154853 RepID=UPI0034303D2A
MPTARAILRYTAIYLGIFVAFYLAGYAMLHILPVDLNPSIQITCPSGDPVLHQA